MKTYQSKKSGEFTVLDITKGIYTIKFHDTGTIIKTGAQCVYNGSARDPYARTVHGVGMIGEGEYKPSIRTIDGRSTKSPAYSLWANMLQRCYIDPANGRRPTYQTCTVHPDWHNYQTFCNDIKQLDGYGLWVAYHAGLGGEKIELDKDVLCKGRDIKEYGPNTCKFITKGDNLRAMWEDRREVAA